MRCDLRDRVHRQIYFYGAYEPIEAFLFRALVQPGMTVVDAGANVGQYALMAGSLVGSDGEVHAFEPVPRNFGRLAAHVSENDLSGTVRTNRLALWNRREQLKLSLAPDMEDNAGSYTAGAQAHTIDVVDCDAVPLDEYRMENRLRRIDIIKMDIEGAELFALQGALDSIAKDRPIMLIEVNQFACAAAGYEPARIAELLRPLGYRMWLIGNSPATSRPVTSLDGIAQANVIFHTKDLPETVVAGWSYKSILRANRRALVI
jgi:FkbM family methyltransferase